MTIQEFAGQVRYNPFMCNSRYSLTARAFYVTAPSHIDLEEREVFLDYCRDIFNSDRLSMKHARELYERYSFQREIRRLIISEDQDV